MQNMLKKFLILTFIVYYASAASTFIGSSKKRAELFELTDNEIAVFRINIPDDEFIQLKEDAQAGLHMGGGGPGGDKMGGEFNITDGKFPDFKNMEGKMEDGGFQFPNGEMKGFNETREGFPGGGEGGMPGPMFGSGDDSGGMPRFSMDQDSFKTKNATMTVELNGAEKTFNKVTISIGGSSSRSFGKQGYNIKVRGKDDLYGRTQFRLRPDAREATYLRSKLVCDMHNRLGLPSISANYATLYINDEYMGLYILMESIKLSWVESEYNDKDSTGLYQCKDMNNNLTVKTSSEGCVNENEEFTDTTEWVEFLTALDNAQSAEDIEDIFDIDQFLIEIAFEYLSGSWDHYLNFGHNFYMYKPKNDKWKFILYDFDGELGQDVSMGARGFGFGQQTTSNNSTDYPSYSFEDWTQPRHLIDILILNDSTRFDNILRKFVTEVFNPATLFPHIDELKEFIRPYVELDKKPNEEGKYPGRINEKAGDYSLAEWDANCEFTKVKSAQGGIAYGLKYWILAKYRHVCQAYNIECDSKYLDENYEYSVDKEVEATEQDSFSGFGKGGAGGPGGPQSNEKTNSSKYNCWVEQLGFSCCDKENTTVYASDGNGDWGYDFEKGEWCGLTPYTEHKNDEECWSKKLGYECCKGCQIYETDSDGKWGYENNSWCGIQSFCPL